jgi:nitrate/TMAO reductase-like tetraheme cytochrome c subunit
MLYKKTAFHFLLAGMTIVIITGILLATATPASAQCGSQASSCKNCHEVQGQMSVNADGTGWHQSHSFGDFCYVCHAGNNQAKDKAAAHEGMVSPLADVKASCQQCHVSDLDARAKVYADILGVEVGSGSAAPAAAELEAVPVSAASTASVSSNQCSEIVVDDPNAVNYAQNYDEIVLGKKPTNWGNMILIGMIGLMVVGGGGFVVTREKFIQVKFGDTRKVEEEYPADVVEMLPKIAGLKAGARRSLKNFLENKKADKVLDLMDAVVKKDEEE